MNNVSFLRPVAAIFDNCKVSQPLENPLGKQSRIGYMKYAQIRTLRPVRARGRPNSASGGRGDEAGFRVARIP